jgi:hypothetical protein
MTTEELKIEMFKAALKDPSARPSAIARRLKCSATLVYMVIAGVATSYRVACEIARVIGRPVTEVFPGKYDHRSDECPAACN